MSDYPLERYGQWSGNKLGNAYNPRRCADEVSDGWVLRQCARKPRHGDRGLFCKIQARQHPAVETERTP